MLFACFFVELVYNNDISCQFLFIIYSAYKTK